MKTRVQKWGNSLALRIPKAFAEETGLRDETPVELSVVKGKLVIAAAAAPKPTLQQLLAGVTPRNRHTAHETGDAVGNEAW